MDVHLLMRIRNYGRNGDSKEKLVVDCEGQIEWIPSRISTADGATASVSTSANSGSLFFRSLGRSFSIPLAWILNAQTENDDQLIIRHFLRDENEFYLFNSCESVFTFPTSEERGGGGGGGAAELDRLLALMESKLKTVESSRPKKLLVILNPKAGWGKCNALFDEGGLDNRAFQLICIWVLYRPRFLLAFCPRRN